VIDPLLPNRTMLSARWGSRRDGRALAQVSEPGDIIVGHSYGCLRAARAADVVPYRRIVCIAPAMPSNWRWPEPWKVTCFHSRDDRALIAARFLVSHPFGGGRAGLDGFDHSAVTNIPCHGCDHSDYFSGDRVSQIADYIERVA